MKYTVKIGDTLWKIAQDYGTTVEAIIRANPRIKDIKPYDTIIIPYN